MKSLDIKKIIDTYYKLGRIESIKPFIPPASKFVNPSLYLFLLATSQGKYFIKSCSYQQKTNVQNDIKNSLYMLNNIHLNIPPIVHNKQGKCLTRYCDRLFTIALYIEGTTFQLESKSINNTLEFFKFYETTNRTLKKISKQICVDFEDRVVFFNRHINELKTAIIKSNFPSKIKHAAYVDFLVSETTHFKKDIKKFKVVGQIVHGDFLKQNIIRDTTNKLWILDWELSGYKSLEVDIMRTITYTLFNPDPTNVVLKISNIIKAFNMLDSYIKETVDKYSLSHIIQTYYYYLLTNIMPLMEFYVYKLGTRGEMLDEDVRILHWYKTNMHILQRRINTVLE